MAIGGLIRRVERPSIEVDWGEFKLWLGLECAAAIAVPLIVGLLTGHTKLGTWGAIGAFLTNFSLFQAEYVLRYRVVAVAGVIVAVGIFMGALVGITDPLVFFLIAVWTFFGGMLVAVNANISMIGVVSTVGVLAATASQATPLLAVEIAGAAMAGGACVLVLARLCRGDQSRSVRRGISDALHSLSAYAAAIPNHESQLPEAGVFNNLATANPQGLRSAKSVDDPRQSLVANLEQLRTLLAALTFIRTLGVGDQAGRIDAVASEADPVNEAIDSFARDVSDLIDGLAQACTDRGESPEFGSIAHRILDAIHTLQRRTSNERDHTAAGLCRAVCRTLQQIWKAIRSTSPPIHNSVSVAPIGPSLDLGDMASAVRSTMTFGSTVFRHALRLSAAVLIASVIYRATDIRDGYWIPIAVVFIMKPDFSSTIARGTMRIIGTVLGATIATLFLATLRPGPVVLCILTVLVSVFAYALFSANYGLFTIFLTCLTVFFAAFLGLPPLMAVANRAVDNVIGASLAILAVLAWPPWVSIEIPHLVAAYLRAQHRLCDAVVSASTGIHHESPLSTNRHQSQEHAEREAAIDALVSDARLARLNTEAAIERMHLEEFGNTGGALSVDTAEAIVDQIRRLGLASLALREYENFNRFMSVPDCTRWRESFAKSVLLFGEALEAGTPCPTDTLRVPGAIPAHWRRGERLTQNEPSLEQRASKGRWMMIDEFEVVTAMSVSLTTAQYVYNRDHLRRLR